MSLDKRLQEIGDELQNFKKNIEGLFGRLETSLVTPEIQEKIRYFKEVEISKISKNILQTIRVIESPIYIGLLGRYSHGKTALVNQLFSIEKEYSLPEGEGIVTSKITRVAFNSKASSPICLQFIRGNNEIKVDIEELRASISGQIADENSEMIDYYSIQIPAKESFSKLLEDKKINLIDMPGLGGLYFKDNEKTRKYMDYVDMLLVVIKITEIEDASKFIEPYISNLSIPIIPVFTFFDIWKESAKFTSCVSDEEALFKAKKLLKTYIPSLSKHEFRTIAVSSREGINISELRECILNFVETQNFAIYKAKSETPEIFKRRVNEISQELNKINIEVENSLNRLQRDINNIIPDNQNRFESFEQSFKRRKDRLIANAKKKISRSLKDIFSDFRGISQEIMLLNDFSEIRERINNIEEKINSTKFSELNSEIEDLIIDFKDNLSDEVVSYIDKLDIDESKRQELRHNTCQQIEDYPSEVDYLIEYKAPSILSDEIQGLAKASVDTILKNLTDPQLIVSVITIIILLTLPSISLFGIGDKISSVTNPILILIIAAFVWKVISSDRTKRLNEAKRKITDKLLSSFDKQKYLQNSQQIFIKTVNDIVDLAEEELQVFTNPYSRDVRKISNKVSDYRIAVKQINKFLQNKIEILESEKV